MLPHHSRCRSHQKHTGNSCQNFFLRCHRFVISLPCNVPTTSFCYLSSHRYCFYFHCYIISSHERFSIMTLYKNDKVFLVFCLLFQFFFYLLQILLRVSTQYAVCPMQISEADFCMAFSDRDHTDQAVPFFFLLQITAEIGKIRLS